MSIDSAESFIAELFLASYCCITVITKEAFLAEYYSTSHASSPLLFQVFL